MDNDKEQLDRMRTAMANERTFLAYLRTALSFLAFGLVVIKFFSGNSFIFSSGVISVTLGVGLFVFGTIIYFARRKKYPC